jgi:hypothetical protein
LEIHLEDAEADHTRGLFWLGQWGLPAVQSSLNPKQPSGTFLISSGKLSALRDLACDVHMT